MAPDFESFLYLSTDVTFAHSLPGVAIFCLPSGTLLFLLFQLLLKGPLLSLAPYAHQQRLLPLVRRDMRLNSPRQWAAILLSLTLGAMTHLLWDAATHEYGWIVPRVTLLQTNVLSIEMRTLKMYTLLQHGGTLVGGIILVYYYWGWYKAAAPTEPTDEIQNFSKKQRCGIASAIIFSGGLVGMSMPQPDSQRSNKRLTFSKTQS